jgi:hypothetical protein
VQLIDTPNSTGEYSPQSIHGSLHSLWPGQDQFSQAPERQAVRRRCRLYWQSQKNGFPHEPVSRPDNGECISIVEILAEQHLRIRSASRCSPEGSAEIDFTVSFK